MEVIDVIDEKVLFTISDIEVDYRFSGNQNAVKSLGIMDGFLINDLFEKVLYLIVGCLGKNGEINGYRPPALQ